MIPKGWGGKGWRSFGKAPDDLLSSNTMKEDKGKSVTVSAASSFPDGGRRSFADVVNSKAAVHVQDKSLGCSSSGGGVGNVSASSGVISKKPITEIFSPDVRGIAVSEDKGYKVSADKGTEKTADKVKDKGVDTVLGVNFKKTLRVELLRGGGRHVVWALIRKPSWVCGPEGIVSGLNANKKKA